MPVLRYIWRHTDPVTAWGPRNLWLEAAAIIMGTLWIGLTTGGHLDSQPRWIFWLMFPLTITAIVAMARGIIWRLDRRTDAHEK